MADIRMLLTSVMIVVGWVVFYSIVAGLVLFGYIANSESSKCVQAYQDYLDEIEANYTLHFNSSNNNSIPFIIKTTTP